MSEKLSSSPPEGESNGKERKEKRRERREKREEKKDEKRSKPQEQQPAISQSPLSVEEDFWFIRHAKAERNCDIHGPKTGATRDEPICECGQAQLEMLKVRSIYREQPLVSFLSWFYC